MFVFDFFKNARTTKRKRDNPQKIEFEKVKKNKLFNIFMKKKLKKIKNTNLKVSKIHILDTFFAKENWLLKLFHIRTNLERKNVAKPYLVGLLCLVSLCVKIAILIAFFDFFLLLQDTKATIKLYAVVLSDICA